MTRFLRTALAAGTLLLLLPQARAHSGKARFHAIVDTDCAADDLRALCLLLGNREVELLAVTTGEGALAPQDAAVRVRALLDAFHHQGVPVGVGRAVHAPAPAWRTHSAQVDWGDTAAVAGPFPAASELIARTLQGEDEPVWFIALGSLTNWSDALRKDPALAEEVERVVWYNSSADPLEGANYRTDTAAARYALGSGCRTVIVSAAPASRLVVTPALLDSAAAVGTPYARRIVDTHRAAPLSRLVAEGHLEAWDDLAVAYLFAPELFAGRPVDRNVEAVWLPDRAAADRAQAQLLAVLRGKPDSESRVFYGFPLDEGLYAADVVPILRQTVARHGPSEWRAGVLTNELHGHLGIYATVGVKMGIRAREYFNIGVDDIEVVSYAGSRPPVSCMNDGLQTSTGATVGHGLIRVAALDAPRPEACFSFKGKTLWLTLKPQFAERIRRDVRRGVERYGKDTEAYWQYIRGLALRYWRDFDRHAIFDLRTDPEQNNSAN